jgi:photosystem II stability/assembly factor-like uncharacterized protein
MSNFTRIPIVIGFLVALVFMEVLAHAALDEPANLIRLSGIPGPFSFEHVCALSSGDTWLVGGGGEIQHFHKGGAAEKVHIIDVDLNGVFFSSLSVGWVVGDRGTILHSDSGGLKWERQTSGVVEDLHAINCADESRCWAVGEKGIILSTKDGGHHWTILKSGFSKRLLAVTFVDHQVGWAVGDDGFIAHTIDGGKAWEKQRAVIVLFPNGPFAGNTDLLAVKFVNENRGWVGGAGGIATTSDGGKTWKATEIEGAAFIGLVSHDGNTVWAVNREGSNYRTRDKGLTWEPLDSEKVSAKRSGCS